MEVIAQLKYIRISPKKITELGRLTVGLTPQQALDKLEYLSGKAPKILSKALNSAQGNAVNNLKLNSQNLVIKEVIIGKGPFFKRWQPVSRGMAHQIKKRTTHIKVKIAEKQSPLPLKPQKSKQLVEEKKTPPKEKNNGS